MRSRLAAQTGRDCPSVWLPNNVKNQKIAINLLQKLANGCGVVETYKVINRVEYGTQKDELVGVHRIRTQPSEVTRKPYEQFLEVYIRWKNI